MSGASPTDADIARQIGVTTRTLRRWVDTGVVPKDGSTIHVFVDGSALGAVTYNLYRSDVATIFPGYQNSSGPVGALTLDTRTLANGVHTIVWSVTDNLGRAEGIGSRYFSVRN